MVYDCHEPIDICRITNYRKHKDMSYDMYHGEKVLLLDNFFSSIYIDDLIGLGSRFQEMSQVSHMHRSNRFRCWRLFEKRINRLLMQTRLEEVL